MNRQADPVLEALVRAAVTNVLVGGRPTDTLEEFGDLSHLQWVEVAGIALGMLSSLVRAVAERDGDDPHELWRDYLLARERSST